MKKIKKGDRIMKKITSFALAILIALSALALVGCGEEKDAEKAELKYGTYVRQNDDAGNFSITINKDGTFSYYETAISSYIGMGNYTVDDGVLTLKDDNIPTVSGITTQTYRFKISNDKLIYIADGSDNFMYKKLSDGAEFNYSDTNK